MEAKASGDSDKSFGDARMAQDEVKEIDDAYKPFGEGNRGEDAKETEAVQQAADLFPEDNERQKFDFDPSSEDDANLSAIDRQYAEQKDVPRRIHIVGTGSIGKLVAHSLRSLPSPPPVTLLFHRPHLIDAWERGPKKVTIHDNGYDVARGGFDVELAPQERMEHGILLHEGSPSVYDVSSDDVRPDEAAKIIEEQQKARASNRSAKSETGQQGTANLRSPRFAKYIGTDPIHNLIVTTKAAYTVPALARLKSRLLPTSTVCFLQNGMGIIDEVNKHLFPDPKERPNYAQGIIMHGANVPPEKAEVDPFYAVHAGHGTIALALLPRYDGSDRQSSGSGSKSAFKFAQSSRYLLRTLTRSPVLCAVGFTPTELLQQQLEKLVINAVINPLTSLLDARNGSLLYNFALTRTMRLMIAEAALIIRSLPELKGVPNVNTRFSPERLETIVVSMANKTKDNISSMLADVRAGRQTEIEYINGYIVRRGEEIGVKCVVNYAIMQTVIGKAREVEKDRREEVPGLRTKLGIDGSM